MLIVCICKPELHFRSLRRSAKNVKELCDLETREAPFYEHELAEALRARVYFEQGHISRGMNLLLLLDRKLSKKHWPYQMCIVKLHLAEVLINQHKLDDAERYAKGALRLAKAMRSKILEAHCHLLVGQIYSFLLQHEKLSNDKTEENCLNVQRSIPDAAIEELRLACRMIESFGLNEISWRSHVELCRLFKFLDEPKLCLEHAQIAYQQGCKLENRIPPELLSHYHIAFNRNQFKSEINSLIEANQAQEQISRSAMAEFQDDRKARILLRVSATVNSIRDLNPLLDAILDQLIQAVGVERALVFLKDEVLETLQYARGRNSKHQSLLGTESVIQSVLEKAHMEGLPFVSADVRKDARILAQELISLVPPGKLFCAPLKVSDRVLGVLYADNSLPAESLTESIISLYAAFCNLAAIAIDNALAHQQLMKEKNELEQYLHHAREEYPEIVGTSAAVESLRDRISIAAASPLDILITGESGTGKELVAQAIYRTRKSKSRKFVAVDCGAISDNLSEAELFGYRRGAFTGALEDRQGLLEAANGGIIFLDEIANLPFRLQAKFLRVLQEREIRRLGETTPRKIDIQVIAATNRNLPEEMRRGRFREDLYYRLKSMEIRVPPLRERLEDIPLLLALFLKKSAESVGGKTKRFSPEAMDLLTKYSYPGNIRELINIVSNSYFSSQDAILGIDQLPLEIRRVDESTTNSDLRTADIIYNEILGGKGDFEELVRRPFLRHQLGLSVIRGIIAKALKDAKGKYRDAFERLRIPSQRYSVIMQFLKRNKCYVDFHPFRRKP